MRPARRLQRRSTRPPSTATSSWRSCSCRPAPIQPRDADDGPRGPRRRRRPPGSRGPAARGRRPLTRQREARSASSAARTSVNWDRSPPPGPRDRARPRSARPPRVTAGLRERSGADVGTARLEAVRRAHEGLGIADTSVVIGAATAQVRLGAYWDPPRGGQGGRLARSRARRRWQRQPGPTDSLPQPGGPSTADGTFVRSAAASIRFIVRCTNARRRIHHANRDQHRVGATWARPRRSRSTGSPSAASRSRTRSRSPAWLRGGASAANLALDLLAASSIGVALGAALVQLTAGWHASSARSRRTGPASSTHTIGHGSIRSWTA